MTIIAIDPSLASTGLVVLKGNDLAYKGTVKTEPTKTAKAEMERLERIIDEIFKVVAKWHEEGMWGAIEGLSFGSIYGKTETRTALNYMIRERFIDWKIPLLIVPPKTLKKFCSGNGNAKKEDMKLAVFKRWHFEDKDDNIIDAYTLARLAECRINGFGTKADMEAVSKVEVI